jgi:4-carboxymuconolactone decarboxylase
MWVKTPRPVTAFRCWDARISPRIRLHALVDTQWVPWVDAAKFQSKAADGRLIGAFNATLFSPEISAAFLAWQTAEEEHTSVDAQVRQVVILAVVAVWKAAYELYAHAALARKVGLPERAMAKLVAGEPCEDLSDAEQIAQQYATRLTGSRRIDADLFAAAKQTFGLKGRVDIANLIGAYTLCGLLNRFAIPSPETPAGAPRAAARPDSGVATF